MFPLIFCSWCSQKFWHRCDFLEWITFVEWFMKRIGILTRWSQLDKEIWSFNKLSHNVVSLIVNAAVNWRRHVSRVEHIGTQKLFLGRCSLTSRRNRLIRTTSCAEALFFSPCFVGMLPPQSCYARSLMPLLNYVTKKASTGCPLLAVLIRSLETG